MRIPKWRQIRFWREKRYKELEEIERRQHANPAVTMTWSSAMSTRVLSLPALLAAWRKVEDAVEAVWSCVLDSVIMAQGCFLHLPAAG